LQAAGTAGDPAHRAAAAAASAGRSGAAMSQFILDIESGAAATIARAEIAKKT
jgi:hypothetical protein